MVFSCSFWTQSTSSPRAKILEHYPGVLKTCQSMKNGLWWMRIVFCCSFWTQLASSPQGKYPWTLSWSLENLSVTEKGFWWMRMIFSCSFWTQLASFPRAKILEYYPGVLRELWKPLHGFLCRHFSWNWLNSSIHPELIFAVCCVYFNMLSKFFMIICLKL